jgi:hypothetical protein
MLDKQWMQVVGISGECMRLPHAASCYLSYSGSAAGCVQHVALIAGNKLLVQLNSTACQPWKWLAAVRICFAAAAAGSTQPPQEVMGGSSRSAPDKSSQGGTSDKELLNAHW